MKFILTLAVLIHSFQNRSVRPGSIAEELGIKINWILVEVNGKNIERMNLNGTITTVSSVIQNLESSDNRSLDLLFRDDSLFRKQLRDLKQDTDGSNGNSVTTQIMPPRIKNDGVNLNDGQQLTVQRLIKPSYCRKGASDGDLLEVSYLGSVLESGDIFDGSAVKINGKAIPGRYVCMYAFNFRINV